MKRTVLLMILTTLGTTSVAFSAEERSLGNWDMSRVVWYRQHPDLTTAELKQCTEKHKGDSECGAAMQACGDLLKEDRQATCQTPIAH